ncbi:MAG: hypothetical protein KIS77_02855 [Saprospiraceae bacterium]|nr:hypothetical protein [Saprospiraceae bacterium]
MKNIFLHTTVLYLWLLPATALAQDPDIEANEQARIEEIFRTSEQAGETPTNHRQRQHKNKRVSVPKGAFRIGCVCMDDTHSDTRSTGACSGHGGVRFWVYRTREGDTVHILTARHELHPHPLSAEEMSELSRKRAARTQNLPTVAPVPYSAPVVVIPPQVEPTGGFGWSDAATLSIAGAAAFFIVRMILRWVNNNEKLVRYALRHLLRHRKRPPPRSNRKNPRKTRLP